MKSNEKKMIQDMIADEVKAAADCLATKAELKELRQAFNRLALNVAKARKG